MSATLKGITLNLQKKYNKANELQDVTKQMVESLQRNDIYSFQLLMKMRTQVMLEIDNIDYEREDLLEELPEQEKQIAHHVMGKQVEASRLASPELQRMHDIYENIGRCIARTIQFDKGMNLKMAGKNSFYKK